MLGIDVHGGKGAVRWQEVAAVPISFAFLKATEGRTFTDPLFTVNRKAAKAAGLLVGAYHFARPDTNSPQAEADHFLSVAKPLAGELLPVLDFETHPADTGWALAWLARVEKAIGVSPLFYTYSAFLNEMGRHTELARYPLWLANYGPNDGREHPVTVPAGFRMVLHQFSSTGRVAGVAGNVDLDVLTAPSVTAIRYRPPAPRRRVYEILVNGKLLKRLRALRPPRVIVRPQR